nr:Transposon Tf2-12 polyprotein [Ipomoea batatas]
MVNTFFTSQSITTTAVTSSLGTQAAPETTLPQPVDSAPLTRFTILEFPTFDGKRDPLIWLHRCELFFEKSQHSTHVKLLLVQADNVLYSQQVSLFTADLDEVLRIDVKRLRPGSLDEAINIARDYARKLSLLRHTPSWRSFPPPTPPSSAVTDEDNDVDNCLEDLEPEISLHAIIGISHSQTMQIRLLIAGTPIIALVDSGSTYNFINVATAHRLHLPISPHTGLCVAVANGEHMPSSGICQNMFLQYDSISFVANLFVIPLAGVEPILGVKLMVLVSRLCISSTSLSLNQQQWIHSWTTSPKFLALLSAYHPLVVVTTRLYWLRKLIMWFSNRIDILTFKRMKLNDSVVTCSILGSFALADLHFLLRSS